MEMLRRTGAAGPRRPTDRGGARTARPKSLVRFVFGAGIGGRLPKANAGGGADREASGRPSPAQWFVDLRENLVLQWAGFGIRPSRSVCYEFRDRLGALLEHWNEQVVGLAIEGRLTDAAEGAIDGSTIAACASPPSDAQPGPVGPADRTTHSGLRTGPAMRAGRKKGAWMAGTPGGRQAQLERYRRAAETLQPRLDANARRIPSQRLPAGQPRGDQPQ